MEPEGRLVERIELDNGLSIHFYDRSREIAGDRHQVQLLIRIPIGVEETYFQHCDEPRKTYETFTSAAGGTIYFQTEKVRNFVDFKEMQVILEALKEEFLRANLNYIAKSSFARKFVLKSYHEWQEQKLFKEKYAHQLRPRKDSKE